jgi:putative flippase GtrA
MNDAKIDCLYSVGASLTVIILVVLCIQLLLIGILGVYTRKIYSEVKGRPLYIVEGTENIEQLSDEKSHLTPDWWKEARYLTRYVGSGLINTLAGFVVIFSAMALGFSPMVSNVAGYALGFTLGFVLSKKFVFRSNGHYVAESVRYLIAFAISFLFNLLVLRLALIYLNFHVVASQVVAAAGYTLLMYTLTRLFVFGTSRASE